MPKQGFKTYKPEEIYSTDNIPTQSVIDIAKALGIDTRAIDENGRSQIKSFAAKAKAESLTIKQAIASYQETQAPTPNAPADEVPQQTMRADTHTIGADLTTRQTREALLQNLARSQADGLLFEVQSTLAFQSGRELLPLLLSGALEPRNDQELALLNALRAALPEEGQMSSFLSWENCPDGENACQQLVFSQVEIPPEYFQKLAPAPTQLAIAPAVSVSQLQESPELQQPPLNVT